MLWIIVILGGCFKAAVWARDHADPVQAWEEADPDWKDWLRQQVRQVGTGDGDGGGDGDGCSGGLGLGSGGQGLKLWQNGRWIGKAEVLEEAQELLCFGKS